MADRTPYEVMLNRFMQAASADIEFYACQNLQLNLPIISKQMLLLLISNVELIFQSEPIFLDIESPCTIVGDIHGHILDLFRILKTQGLPDKTRYVFLGDLVDRGEFSVETIALVYLLKFLWPQNVFIIRGNHEFDFLASQCGFKKQLLETYYDESVYRHYLSSFSEIPLAIRIDNKMLCVHGGIGPSLFSVKQIASLKKPIFDFGSELIDPLLWSDPNDSVESFEPSSRGTGFFFSESVLAEFLNLSNLEVLVRAHECVMEGSEAKFHGKLITVFSASNYCGIVKNMSAIIKVTAPMELTSVRFPPLDYLKRPIHVKTMQRISTSLSTTIFNSARVKSDNKKFPSLSPSLPMERHSMDMSARSQSGQCKTVPNFKSVSSNRRMTLLPNSETLQTLPSLASTAPPASISQSLMPNESTPSIQMLHQNHHNSGGVPHVASSGSLQLKSPPNIQAPSYITPNIDPQLKKRRKGFSSL